MNKVLGKRAVSEQQKGVRRESVLSAARRLFIDAGFFDVSMSMIAKEAKVAKGTVYLYFKTKEEIFLELSKRDFEDWFDCLYARIEAESKPLTNRDFSDLFSETLRGRETAIRLMSLLHLVLEKNVSYDDVLEYKLALLQKSAKLSELVEETLPFLSKGEGIQLLAKIHSLLIGWGQMCDVSPVVDQVLEHEMLADLRFDFHSHFTESLFLLLEGMKSATFFASK
ncbi:TetR family transcriptional regulator [Sneathiella sp. P13V-1]|uniref:TetR/AcrR family transcriptional regulator n=1 Tax=Sneathiella sp. P13V-1 TaxID=2697366 RepID=UPI00187B7E0C|nr:TetR family transcriptional regulator [Sneathiella sp. P13V-1]MBE7637309.1 TetR family transcriptional regulator [Sneathiella sp. P13V-1]